VGFWGTVGLPRPHRQAHRRRRASWRYNEKPWFGFSGEIQPFIAPLLGPGEANNLEMLIKVLDACAFNNRYWVFFSAGTNVEFTLTVTDTRSGAAERPH
jgi:hypothetical protein